MPGSRVTQVFVSHISEEREVAALLSAMLHEAFAGQVEVFTSSNTQSIVAGKNWLQVVHHALQEAAVLVVLCSKASLQRSWVQFELGAAWMRDIPIIPVCHSGMKLTDLPLPLSLQNGAEVTQDGLERLYWAVADAVETPDKPSMELLARHLQLLQAEEKHFRANAVVQFELALDVVLPAPGRLPTAQIPAEAVVEANEETLLLFGYFDGPLTWGQIHTAARGISRDQRWLKELQTCIYLASNNLAFRPVQAIFHTESLAYQPQLSKREVLPDDRCRFHVHLVQTVVAPLMDVQNQLGLLATLVRLGLRMRYEVIEKFTNKLRAAADPETAAEAPSADELRTQIRSAIDTIETDAMSRGAANFDKDAIIDLFDADADHVAMRHIFSDWKKARTTLFCDAPAPDAAQMYQLMRSMREVNRLFMHFGSRRFHEMVDKQWGLPGGS